MSRPGMRVLLHPFSSHIQRNWVSHRPKLNYRGSRSRVRLGLGLDKIVLTDKRLGSPLQPRCGIGCPGLSSENTVEQQWTYISAAMYEAAAKSIGHKSRNHTDWFDVNSDTIHNLHKEHQITLDIPSSTNTRQHWKAAQRKVQKSIRAINKEWWTQKAYEIPCIADKNNMHHFYNAVKSICGPINRCIAPLKTADGWKIR